MLLLSVKNGELYDLSYAFFCLRFLLFYALFYLTINCTGCIMYIVKYPDGILTRAHSPNARMRALGSLRTREYLEKMRRVIKVESLKDTLTSFYTLESGAKQVAASGFLEKKHCQLALIHTAGLADTIADYGSAFAMTLLANQSIQVRSFFSRRDIDAIFCRVVKHTFAIFFSDIDDKECQRLMTQLFEKLDKNYYGRS